jgi:hypothetical protein
MPRDSWIRLKRAGNSRSTEREDLLQFFYPTGRFQKDDGRKRIRWISGPSLLANSSWKSDWNLATAIEAGCDLFITSDFKQAIAAKKLGLQVSEIKLLSKYIYLNLKRLVQPEI